MLRPTLCPFWVISTAMTYDRVEVIVAVQGACLFLICFFVTILNKTFLLIKIKSYFEGAKTQLNDTASCLIPDQIFNLRYI